MTAENNRHCLAGADNAPGPVRFHADKKATTGSVVLVAEMCRHQQSDTESQISSGRHVRPNIKIRRFPPVTRTEIAFLPDLIINTVAFRTREGYAHLH